MGSENFIIIPTYQECVKDYNSHPVAIIDVVCCHKGRPQIGIEICHKNHKKIKKVWRGTTY